MKQKVTEMSSKTKESNPAKQEESSGQDTVEDIDGGGQTETVMAASSPSSDGLRRRNVKDTSSSSQEQSRTTNTDRPVRNDGNNITSLLVLWALIFVIVMLALRRLLYM